MSIVWIGEPSSKNASLVGKKAANLSVLKYTHQIPEGFIIPATDFFNEEFTLLKGDLKRVASSIPDRTDLTEVFDEINNLKKRLNNIPEYDGHLALIRTEIAELENSINDLPTIP